jgi:hypothetical protein
MALREGGPLPQNGRRPRSERVSDRETDPEIIPGDHIPTRTCARDNGAMGRSLPQAPSNISLGIRVSLKFQVGLFGFLKVRVYINRTRINTEQSDTRKFGYPESLGLGSGSGSSNPLYLNYIISPK